LRRRAVRLSVRAHRPGCATVSVGRLNGKLDTQLDRHPARAVFVVRVARRERRDTATGVVGSHAIDDGDIERCPGRRPAKHLDSVGTIIVRRDLTPLTTADETTIPIKHMLAPSTMTVPAEQLDKEFFELAGSEGVTDLEELNKVLDRAVGLRTFLTADDRIEQVAAFVAEHFKESVLPLG
jgi:hypothetical protein